MKKIIKMIDKQLQQIYAAYFPYDLEMAYVVRDNIEKIGILKTIDYNESETYPLRLGIENMYDMEHEWMFKPFLYDFESITKEIFNKGENFVPILKLCDYLGLKYIDFKLLDNSVDLVLNPSYHRANTKTKEPQKVRLWVSNHKGLFINCSNMRLLTYKDLYGAIQKLIEWKINVFNLPKDKYINYETKR